MDRPWHQGYDESTAFLRTLHTVSTNLQVTTVWMTAAMLFAQAVCPDIGFGCGCQRIDSSTCSLTQKGCCCSKESESSPQSECPHCSPPAESQERDNEFQQDSICHCGDGVPLEPVQQRIPDSSESSLKLLVDQIVNNNNACLATTIIPAPTAASPAVPLSQEHEQPSKQSVLCIWLT